MSVVRVSLALVLLSTIGCATLQQVRQPAEFIPKNNPPVVYVTYTDNSIVPVAQPQIKGDSLLGTWQGLSEPVAVPLAQVQSVQAVQHNKKRTTLLIVGLTAFTAAGAWAVSQATGNGSGDHCIESSGQTPEIRC